MPLTEQDIINSGRHDLMAAYMAGVFASQPVWDELRLVKRMWRAALAALAATECEACQYGPDNHCPRHAHAISQRKHPKYVRVGDHVLSYQPEGFIGE